MKRAIFVSEVLSLLLICSCRPGDSNSQTPIFNNPLTSVTSTPAPYGTNQAEIALTAAWVRAFSLSQPYATPTEAATVDDFPVNTTDRFGDCLSAVESEVHFRQGFCIVAPNSWISANVDGGMAAALNTTPGQVISLQPDWADDPAQCHLLIYIAPGDSARNHLVSRYREYQVRTDIASLSDISVASLDGLQIPGFTWEDKTGASGGVFAAVLTPGKLLHISEGGTNCPLANLVPVLDTLRFSK